MLPFEGPSEGARDDISVGCPFAVFRGELEGCFDSDVGSLDGTKDIVEGEIEEYGLMLVSNEGTADRS